MTSRTLREQALLILVLICITGCSGASGPKRFPIEGSVTLDGQPLETGSVTFVPQGGSTATSATIENGAFFADEKTGLPPGNYRVEIMSTRKTGRKIPGPGPDGQVDEVEQIIPARYNTQSELVAGVEDKETNRFEFELSSP
jgi:hypothetical protein